MKAKKQDFKLVEVHGERLNTTSLVMAELCGVKHSATIKLVRKYEKDLKEIGFLRFEIRENRGTQGAQTEIALLDDYAAILLMTHMRSNPKVAQFKKNLVYEFKRLRKLLSEPNRKEALQYKRDAHTPMMDMLKFTREGLDKLTETKDFSNENKFCNRALTGNWAACDESLLDVYDARLLEAIRKHNTLLISRYPVQKPERKKAMEQFVSDYRTKHPRFTLIEAKK